MFNNLSGDLARMRNQRLDSESRSAERLQAHELRQRRSSRRGRRRSR